jgi:hypothetical protein
MVLTHTKKVDLESFIKERIRSQTSGSDQKGPDPQHCQKLKMLMRITGTFSDRNLASYGGLDPKILI